MWHIFNHLYLTLSTPVYLPFFFVYTIFSIFSVKSNNLVSMASSSIWIHGNNVIDNLVKTHLTSCVRFLLNCLFWIDVTLHFTSSHNQTLALLHLTWIIPSYFDFRFKKIIFVFWMKPGLKTCIYLESFIFQCNQIHMSHYLFPAHVFKLNYTPLFISHLN